MHATNGPCLNCAPSLSVGIYLPESLAWAAKLTGLLLAVDDRLHPVLLASYSRTAWLEHLAPLSEPPSQEHGTSRNLHPVGKVSIAVPSRSVWRSDTSGSCGLFWGWTVSPQKKYAVVVAKFTATLNSRSHSKTLRTLCRKGTRSRPWISTSSKYSSQIWYTSSARTMFDMLRWK